MEERVRFISTAIHGILDYVVGLIVIGLPFLLQIDGTPRAITIVLGLLVILYSAVTDYELGALRILRIRVHLTLDVLFGAGMLMVPSILDLQAQQSWPYYVIGVLALVLSGTTRIRASGTASTN